MIDTAVMVVTYQNKALILKRSITAPWQPGKWNLPGGEIGQEYPIDAALRECKEEAGVSPIGITFIGNIEYIAGFHGTVNSDNVIIVANEGIIESDAWEWIGLNDIEKYQFAHYAIPLFIHDVLRKMTMQLVEDKVVWTCEPTIECGFDDRLHKPHQVKLKQRRQGVWYGHGFCEATGYVDTDPNATIIAKEHNCFETKREACDYYERYLKDQIEQIQAELQNFQDNRND